MKLMNGFTPLRRPGENWVRKRYRYMCRYEYRVVDLRAFKKSHVAGRKAASAQICPLLKDFALRFTPRS